MSQIRLDEEEKALLSAYENDEWESVSNFEEEKEKYLVKTPLSITEPLYCIKRRFWRPVQMPVRVQPQVKTLQHLGLPAPVVPATDSMIVDSLPSAAPKSIPLH